MAELHPRRYLLRHTSIELFLKDKSTFFLNLRVPDACREAIKKLLGLRRAGLLVVTRQTKARLLKEATAAWRARRTSNFEYLMGKTLPCALCFRRARV